MSEHRHEDLRRLFDLLVQAPPPERAEILNRECGGDATLRARLQAMVIAAEDDAFLSAPTDHAQDPTAIGVRAALRAAGERPGSMIGQYKLLQLIGEGGFGSVFMAEQEKPVQRKVALKIIKLGMDTHQVVARFEQERQALAMMDHPNIARVLEAGATETGRPYFVMDLVAGLPIVDYCDRHKLSIHDRLALFGQVCSAVQHAHTKGIIHRDIKPSNVLVSTVDGRPVAKVIDFGIAKATVSKLTEKTLFTEFRQLVGTPEYMSPEQAEGSMDIDTRTDVYSLGVLLYELLTSTTPFDGRTLRSAAFAEIQRIIREVEPPKPSTRLNQSTVTLASIAANRRAEPARLGAVLRGELDWIVMKALEKDRQRRYESAGSLATDIQRYLSGEPVAAAPPARTYLFRKFVHRHKVAVFASTAALILLIISVVAIAWHARQVASERDAAIDARVTAQHARQAAELQRQRADAINSFMLDALESSDPNQGGSQDMLVADAMRQAEQRLDQGAFKDQPEIEGGLRLTISRILAGNGQPAKSLPMAERALAIFRGLHPGDDPDVATALDNLAQSLQSSGRPLDAESALVQALDMRRRLYPGDHPDVATSLDNLASQRDFLGRTVEAEPMYIEALEMRRRLFKGDHADIALSIANVAFARHAQGDYAKAQALYEEALAMRRRLYKGDHPQIAMSMNSLAYVLQDQGRTAQAEPLFVEALAMHRRLFSGDHSDVAMGLNNLGFVRKSQGRLEEAEQLLSQSVEMSQRLTPGDHPNIAMSLETLADIRAELGRPAEAEPLYVRCVEMNRRIYHNADNLQFAKSMASLARVRRTLGKAAESRSLLDDTIAMLRRMPPDEAILSLARVLSRSAADRLADGDPPGAVAEAQESVAIAEARLPPDAQELKDYRDMLDKCRQAAAR